MSKAASFEKINYLLRPNKQVERKMIIDLLSGLSLDLPISNYQYVGMGSIYYYDFILIHKYFNITKMVSIDNKSCHNRFLFNRPYDFVNFENCFTSDYLFRHEFKNNSLFWLDYDGHISGNESLKKDISILGKNCIEGDLYFVTVNCETPKNDNARNQFLQEFKKFIPPGLNHLKSTAAATFPQLVQEILINMLADSCEYNQNKFMKVCSFLYKDGAPMYTLGGLFTKDIISATNKFKDSNLFQLSKENIFDIKIPNITYKEKFYLDSNITTIEKLIEYSQEYWKNNSHDHEGFERGINSSLANALEFELSYNELTNYIKNYRFVPQYYETVI
jgi:hypothetical protein